MIGRIGLIVSLSLVLSTCAFAIVPPVGNVAPEEITLQYPPPNLIPVNTAPGGSIGLLKYLPDGTQVEIAGKVISALIGGQLQTTFYVQEADRSAGIRVTTPQYPSLQVGEAVNISGVLATVNGERVLQAGTITDCSLSSLAAPEPILLSLADIGGGPAGYQPGVTLRVPSTGVSILDAIGINNVGLLAQIYGKITYISGDQTYFYVDDGSDVYFNSAIAGGMDDNIGSDVWDGTTHEISGSTYKNLGVMVRADSSTLSLGTLVGVIGIVGTRLDDQNRVLPLLYGEVVSSTVLTRDMHSSTCNQCVLPETTNQLQFNLTCLPLPIAVNPSAVSIMGRGYMWTYYPVTPAQVRLPFDQQDGLVPLSNFRHGTGYWLRLKEANEISYMAVDDDATDRWISLPYPWYNLFGHPLNHDVLWSDLKVTDGKRMAGLEEAARTLNWVCSVGVWWEPAYSSSRDIGLPDDYAYTETMQSWHAYHMYAYKPVALIVPGTIHTDTVRGSIAATVTDTNTPGNPLIGARVYCKYGSALTTEPNGTALIDGLPTGDYLVTASAKGYKSQTKSGSVDGDTVNFALDSQGGFILWLTANPTRIAPNGTSESIITAHVTDLEGAPLSGKSVTITTDMSTFQGGGTSVTGNTGNQGTLSATLVALATPNTATCESSTARAYVEFADANIPSVRIESPTEGNSVTGRVEITVQASSAVSAIKEVRIFIDGIDRGRVPYSGELGNYSLTFNTIFLTNGAHELRAVATDGLSVSGYSQTVHITSYNDFSGMALSRPEIFMDDPAPQSFLLTGNYSGSGSWRVEVTDYNGQVITSSQGPSGPVAFQWDGRIGGSFAEGLYKVLLVGSVGTGLLTTTTPEPLPVAVTWDNAHVLIAGIGTFSGEDGAPEPEWSVNASYREMGAVFQACVARGLRCTLILDPLWLTQMDTAYAVYPGILRKGLADRLPQGYSVFFFTGHGKYGYEDEVTPYFPITYFKLRDNDVFSIKSLPGVTQWMKDNPGRYPFVSDLNLIYYGQLKIVMMNCCYSACADDMAAAFGMYSSSNQELMDQTYVGWSFEYIPGSNVYGGSSLTEQFWSSLAQGHSVYQAHFNACFWSPFAQCAFYRDFGYPETTWLP